jgi:hypothetical protein
MGSKPLHIKLRAKRNHPPEDQPWVWFTREMLESEAWHSAPTNTRRVVERVILEHMAHAGTMNGDLTVTYADFEKFGIRLGSIAGAIKDAAARGWIIITQKGRASRGEDRWPSNYALGWLPFRDGAAAANKWKSWSSGNPVKCKVRNAKPPAPSAVYLKG